MENLNTIPKTGNYGSGVDLHNDNYSKIGLKLETLENMSFNEKGYFETLSALQTKYHTPQSGWQAYVKDAGSSTGYYVANVNSSGNWVVTSAEAPAVGANLNDYTLNGGSSKTTQEIEDEIVQLAGVTDGKIENISNQVNTIQDEIVQLAGVTDGKIENISNQVNTIQENMSSLMISCFYSSISEMESDHSPINENTGEPLKIGELAAISNPADTSDTDNGKIYAWTGYGWRYMGHLESITSMQFTDNFFDTI